LRMWTLLTIRAWRGKGGGHAEQLLPSDRRA
jgi:hypothetical protein